MTEAELYQEQVKTCKQVQNMINELYVSKDKIRDKIKELEWYGEYIKYRFVYTDYDKEVNKVKIETLKELLEEK